MVEKPKPDLSEYEEESVEESENRLQMYRRKTALFEQYLKVEACFGLRCVRGKFEQRGFVFERLPLGEEKDGSLPCSDDYKLGRLSGDREEPFMFTRNIKLMERPEERVASIIRAHAFEDAQFRVREPLFTFFPFVELTEMPVARENRKMRVAAGRCAVALRESGGKQIEGSTERIDDRPHASVENAWQVAMFSKYRDFLAGVRIDIGDAGIRVLPGVKLGGEEWEFGFAPLDGRISV